MSITIKLLMTSKLSLEQLLKIIKLPKHFPVYGLIYSPSLNPLRFYSACRPSWKGSNSSSTSRLKQSSQSKE